MPGEEGIGVDFHTPFANMSLGKSPISQKRFVAIQEKTKHILSESVMICHPQVRDPQDVERESFRASEGPPSVPASLFRIWGMIDGLTSEVWRVWLF